MSQTRVAERSGRRLLRAPKPRRPAPRLRRLAIERLEEICLLAGDERLAAWDPPPGESSAVFSPAPLEGSATWPAAAVSPLSSSLTIQTLDPRSITGSTGEKPQSKVWQHDNRWWTVFSDESETAVWRLDGLSWTKVLTLTSALRFRADVRPSGDVVHVLLEKDSRTKLASIEYVAGSPGTYRLWSQRPQLVDVPLPTAETATIELDSTGRMWLAYANGSNIDVHYSDSPYASFSGPVVLATGVNDDDIAAITALPGGSIGVLWSNQTTRRFGFRTHRDGDPPDAAFWTADEVPASGSALSVGGGMADDHLNLAVASNGTLYAAVKTSYNSADLPAVALLVRRPGGTWDPLYGVDLGGTRPLVLLNEAQGLVLVAFTATEKANDIVFRSSSLSSIAFGPRETLIAGSFNDASSTRQNVTGQAVVIASASGILGGAVVSFGPASNQSPFVDAGPDQIVSLAHGAVLDGTVEDDGLPDPPGYVAVRWKKVSGPGEVSFGDAASIDTTASFSEAGTYVLRLEADDGEQKSSDDVTIDVRRPAVNVSPTSGLVTSETGATAQFSVRLEAPPLSDVSIAVYSANTSEGVLSTGVLTFTRSNWDTPQTVTVTGVNDDIDDDNIAYTVVLAPAASADPAYDGLDPPDVALVNVDDDTAGVTVWPTSGLVTSEGGGTASFGVHLNSQPLADVTIELASSDESEGTLSVSRLVFTPLNWNTTQNVIITGVDDQDKDGHVAYRIATRPATSADPKYNGLDPADVEVTNLDNEPSGVVFYFSIASDGPVGCGGPTFANEDLIAFDGTSFWLFFDGSDVGLASFVLDAFAVISDTEILMSFTDPGVIPGIEGTVDDSDIVKFTATSLGENTAGRFELYFRGANVGLTTNGEDIDAVELLPDGRLLISTASRFSVPGASGEDEDLLVFTPTALGAATAGTWALYFDGSDVGLDTTNGEDLTGVAVDGQGRVFLTTKGSFAVAGVSGKNEDVFVFQPSSLGSTTAGTFDSKLFFDGSFYCLGPNALTDLSLPPPAGPLALRHFPESPRPHPAVLAVGVDAGAPPRVIVTNTATRCACLSIEAYDRAFLGGVRVAQGDLNGDGYPEIITAPGPGGGPHVRVFDGLTGQPLPGPVGSFFAYDPAFTGGVFVAAGDLDGDGVAEIITGADAGGGPHVRVFRGRDGAELVSYFAYHPSFSGGVRVAVADVDGDGQPDVITAAGAGGGPHVRVFSGLTDQQIAGPAGSFFAYAPTFSGGVFIAAADVDGDGRADLVTGAGAGGGPHVRAFSGRHGSELAGFFAYAPQFAGGVRVATADLDGDNRADVLTAPGPGGGPHIRGFHGTTGRELASFYAFPSTLGTGLFPAAVFGDVEIIREDAELVAVAGAANQSRHSPVGIQEASRLTAAGAAPDVASLVGRSAPRPAHAAPFELAAPSLPGLLPAASTPSASIARDLSAAAPLDLNSSGDRLDLAEWTGLDALDEQAAAELGTTLQAPLSPSTLAELLASLDDLWL